MWQALRLLGDLGFQKAHSVEISFSERGEKGSYEVVWKIGKIGRRKLAFQKAERATAKPFYIRASIECWGMIKSCMRLTGREVFKEKKTREKECGVR